METNRSNAEGKQNRSGAVQEEYELISYEMLKDCKLYLNDLTTRGPHAHEEIEIGAVLHGEVSILQETGSVRLLPGGIYVINRYQVHAFSAVGGPCRMIGMQIGQEFYRNLYPDLLTMKFDVSIENPDVRKKLYGQLLAAALSYFPQDPTNILAVASEIYGILDTLCRYVPHVSVSESTGNSARINALRVARMAEYISEHSAEPITLAELAETEHISEYYASHFFRTHFGMSFRDHLALVRFQNAFRLVNETNLNMLDICMESGFSSTRYLNEMFVKQLGCTVREYRQNKMHMQFPTVQIPAGTVQTVYSPEEALAILMERERVHPETNG